MSDLRRYADRFTALGHAVRLQILRRLRRAHPDGMVVGEIQKEIGVPASTLSHHLDVLYQEGLRLEELVHFLSFECSPPPGEPTAWARGRQPERKIFLADDSILLG